MIERAYYLHYQTVRGLTMNTLTVGAALLLGYLVVWSRL
jgi:hypothetical protein